MDYQAMETLRADMFALQHKLNVMLIRNKLHEISNRPGYNPLDYEKFLEEKYFMMAAAGCDFSDISLDQQEIVLAALKKMIREWFTIPIFVLGPRPY